MFLHRLTRVLGLLCVVALCGCSDGNGTVNNNPNPTPNPNSPVTVTPTAATVAPGQPAAFTLTVQSATVPASAVVLSVTGLPTNAVALFNPPQVPVVNNTLNGTSTLTVTPDVATPAGVYPLTIQGTVGATTFGVAQATLTVQPAGSQQSFNLTVSPSNSSVTRTSPANFTATVTTTGGFSSSVTLTVVGGGGDFTVSNPTPNVLNLNGQTSATSGFTVSLAPTSTATAPISLTVTATGGGITRTSTVTVQPQ